MARYILRRLAFFVPLLILVSVLTFIVLVALPGDPLDRLVLSDPRLTPAEIQAMREVYGVDDPAFVQYGRWVGLVVQGNLGFSRTYRAPVVDVIGPALRNTIILAGLTLVVSLIISIPIGIYSAVRPYSIGDNVSTFLSFVGFAIPNFWLGLVFIIVFSVHLGWLPAGGVGTPGLDAGLWEALADRGRHLVMPVAVFSLSTMALWTRYMRSSILEVVGQDYIQTAHSKGLSERAVIGRHALRNALIPMISLFAITVQLLASGAVIIEKVFSYPGLGKLLFDSVMTNDYSVTMAVLMVLTLLVVGLNLVADIMYGVVDPRIRYD